MASKNIRYVITHTNLKTFQRVMTGAATSVNTHATRKDAQIGLKNMLKHTIEDTFVQALGGNSSDLKFKVMPVECYSSGDPMRTIFRDSELEIQRYVIALIEAEKAALSQKDSEDGGSCNFDCPVIETKGFLSKSEIEAINSRLELKGHSVKIGERLTSKIWRGCNWVHVTLHGQAMKRTKMAEAAYKALKTKVVAHMYYQAD